MKKLLIALSVVALLGQGCPVNNPQKPPGPSQPSKPQASYVGCTPKSATVIKPQPGDTVSLPFEVIMKVENRLHPDCVWILFEGQAGTMRLLDNGGITVGTGILMTAEDWMTDGPVTFTGTIPNIAVVNGAATLVITEEDPSGMGTPEEIMIPLTIQ